MSRTIRRKLSLDEIGCALSHIRLWKKMVQENVPIAMIFEDDVEVVLKDDSMSFLNVNVERIRPFNFLIKST